MSDDIVRRLRDEARRPAMREVCSEAADTIARLYAAGDALAVHWEEMLWTGEPEYIAWKEARRG